MKIVVAPDSFKGALGAPEVARSIAAGWRRVFPDAEVVELPLADGGEGTAAALVAATGGELRGATVAGPLGDPVDAVWGLLPGGVAVVELAAAAGLTQVPSGRRDPKVTTTRGVGELIREAVRSGVVRSLIVGLGGSATNDGGAGILQALDVRLLDAGGSDLPSGGAALAGLKAVGSGDRADLATSPLHEVLIACDVDNPLTGPRGASAVFGPQKGATPEDIALLDAALARFAAVLGQAEFPGAGAAGGAAYGLKWLFPTAQIRPGIDIVLDAVGFERHLVGADLALSGEGRIDAQTLSGKAVAGVARRAQAAGVPVAALVGGIGADVGAAALAAAGIEAVLSIAPGPCSLDESIRNAAPWLADAAERAARWFRLSAG